MLFSRTTSGLDFVDVSVGGLYSNRTYILRGPSQSGRTTVCLQFLISGIENGENGIMISSERIENVILKAEQLGLSLDKYLMDNRLVLIEYPKEILTGHYQYGGIIQLLGEIEEYIQHFNCQRLVFDTLTPLLIKPREQEQANYIYSLMNALESLNTTALVTTGSPNSAAATRIIDLLEDAAVGSFVTDLIPSEDDPQRIFTIRKMVNPMNPPQSMKIRIEYGQGIVQDFSVEEEVKKRKKVEKILKKR